MKNEKKMKKTKEKMKNGNTGTYCLSYEHEISYIIL